MSRHRSTPPSVAIVTRLKPWAVAVAAALACQVSLAATLGHSRLVSALGQPLLIDVQVTNLESADSGKVVARPAPPADWAAAGLTPPVDLSSLVLTVVDGYARGSKIIQVRSPQAFDKPVADLLLDVRMPSGQQRYQVSLLTQGEAPVRQASAEAAGSAGGASAGAATRSMAGKSIRVHRGDTLFAIARKHAVKGVTVYQMMMALQRANPQSFIDGNVNLVKAGARLVMPDMTELTALSRSEAKRQFLAQAQAFAQYRQKLAGTVDTAGNASQAASGLVSAGGKDAMAGGADKGPQDQLKLSGRADKADDDAATHANIDESVKRVSQLEENVQHLNKALQAQGGAASSLLMEGARTLSDTLAASTGGSGTAGTDVAAAGGNTPGSVATDGASSTANAGSGASGGATGGNAATKSGTAGSAEGGAAAKPATEGSAGGNAAAKSGTEGSTAIQSSSGAALPGAGEQPGADGASSSHSAGAQDAASPDQNSTKAGQTVSWFQEHTLGVITGVLALIVLIIAWLLRRANAARGDGRDGVITEAMVQEKLEQINLDLAGSEDSPPVRRR